MRRVNSQGKGERSGRCRGERRRRWGDVSHLPVGDGNSGSQEMIVLVGKLNALVRVSGSFTPSYDHP